MGVLGSKGGNALKYWGTILESAYQGRSTADMWTAIRAVQQQYGLPSPQADAIDVSVIRGYANRVVNAGRALGAAQPGDSITADMMAVAPYTAQDLAGIAATPTYLVRFQNTVQAADGTISTVWQTSVRTAVDMPSTVGDLQNQISFDAANIAANASGESTGTPQGTSLGISNLEISVV